MSFFKDLAGFLIMTGGDELKNGASLLGKATVTTAEAVSADLIDKIDETIENHNKKVYEKNKDKQVNRFRASMWLGRNMNLFHKKDEKQIQEMVVKLTNEQFLQVTKHLKKPSTMFFVSLFLGVFGVDRFILGDIRMGIIKLMTFGGMLVLWLIDLFTINNRTKFYNFNNVNNIFRIGVMDEEHK